MTNQLHEIFQILSKENNRNTSSEQVNVGASLAGAFNNVNKTHINLPCRIYNN